MKKLLLVLVAVFGLISLSGCGGKDLTISDEGPLKIGMECAYAPFNWTTSSSTEFTLPIKNLKGSFADGYDIQIAKHLSKELDREVEIYTLEWDALILELKAGKIDLIIAGMSPTEARKEQVQFTNGYYETSHVVLMKKDSKYNIATKLADFTGAKAVGQKATLYDSLIDQLPGVTHQTALDTIGNIVMALNSGASDISIVERPVAQALVAANPTLEFITLQESFVLEESDAMVSIALNYGNEKYLDLINTALAKLSSSDRTALMDAAVGRQ